MSGLIVQTDNSGTVEAIATEATLAAFLAAMASTGNTYTRVKIDQASAATLELIAKSGTLVMRIHALVLTFTAASTIQVETKSNGTTTDLTGEMNYPANGGPNIAFIPYNEGCLTGTAAYNLQITVTGGGFNGYAIVSSNAS